MVTGCSERVPDSENLGHNLIKCISKNTSCNSEGYHIIKSGMESFFLSESKTRAGQLFFSSHIPQVINANIVLFYM